LFGAFSPITGDACMLDLPYCNSLTFQKFLDTFTLQNPTELKIMFLDNGAFHKAKGLMIPKNIILVFLPPYSPELNPAEKVWWVLKREINLKVFKSMNDLHDFLYPMAKKIVSENNIIKLTSYDIYRSAFRTILDL
jgi:transposase